MCVFTYNKPRLSSGMISQNLLFKNILLQSMCVCVSVQCERRAQSPKEVLDPLELELQETGLLPWCGELDFGSSARTASAPPAEPNL